MVSASVMALARLLFEFGPDLQLVVSQLIPPVCSLLRSKARETIKAVLGFVKARHGPPLACSLPPSARRQLCLM